MNWMDIIFQNNFNYSRSVLRICPLQFQAVVFFLSCYISFYLSHESDFSLFWTILCSCVFCVENGKKLRYEENLQLLHLPAKSGVSFCRFFNCQKVIYLAWPFAILLQIDNITLSGTRGGGACPPRIEILLSKNFQYGQNFIFLLFEPPYVKIVPRALYIIMRFFQADSAPRCPGIAAGAVSLRKSHDIAVDDRNRTVSVFQ